MRWHYRDPVLLWLFVPAYLVHLMEEYWAGPGLPAWFARILGRELPEAAFIAVNGVAFVLLIAAVRAAVRREAAGWIAVATVVSLNAVLHLLGALATASYFPANDPQRTIRSERSAANDPSRTRRREPPVV